MSGKSCPSLGLSNNRKSTRISPKYTKSDVLPCCGVCVCVLLQATERLHFFRKFGHFIADIRVSDLECVKRNQFRVHTALHMYKGLSLACTVVSLCLVWHVWL